MRQVRRRVPLALPATEDVSSHRTAFTNSVDKRHTTSYCRRATEPDCSMLVYWFDNLLLLAGE